MPLPNYAAQAENVVTAWERHYDKDLTVRDAEGLLLMIMHALHRAAWNAQQDAAEPVPPPDA